MLIYTVLVSAGFCIVMALLASLCFLKKIRHLKNENTYLGRKFSNECARVLQLEKELSELKKSENSINQ